MRSLFENTKGTASVEYLIVTAAVLLGVASIIWLIGPGLVEAYRLRVAWLGLPFP